MSFSISRAPSLGAALLIVSGSLLVVDVGGTYALEAMSEGPTASAATAAAIDPLVPDAARAMTVLPTGTPAPAGPAPSARAARAPSRSPGVRRKIAASSKAPSPRLHAKPRRTVIAVRSPVVAARSPLGAIRPPVVAVRAPAAARPQPQRIATLREVRRYVMAEIKARDPRAAFVSGMTYATGHGVFVQLVVRDSRGERFENTLVRRTGSHLAILTRSESVIPGNRHRVADHAGDATGDVF
jgi:hypothetical protein